MDNIKSIKYKLPQIIELEKLILLIGFKHYPYTFSIIFNDEPDVIQNDMQYCYHFNKWRVIIGYKEHDMCSNRIDFELAGLHRDDFYDDTEILFFGRCDEDDLHTFNKTANYFRDRCKEVLYLEFKQEIRKNKIKKLLD